MLSLTVQEQVVRNDSSSTTADPSAVSAKVCCQPAVNAAVTHKPLKNQENDSMTAMTADSRTLFIGQTGGRTAYMGECGQWPNIV
jgi:hypothetical protein